MRGNQAELNQVFKLGVGLATCRQIVQRHGGEISVESAPAEGATFTVSLPTASGLAGNGNAR